MIHRISVITPAYNAASTLGDCIASVSRQDVEVEHILIDGASTDSTIEIIERHRNSLAKVVSEPDKGMYHAMNKGLLMASGDVVAILNADDYYPSNDVLAKVIDAFTDPEIDACYGDLIYVDSKDTGKVVRFWRSSDYNPRRFYWGWMPPHPAFFVRRSVYEEYGLFNLELDSSADYEIMLRFLLKHRLKAAYIPQILVHMRTGGISNMTVGNRLKANKMDREAWKVNGLQPYPWTLLAKPVRKIGQWVAR